MITWRTLSTCKVSYIISTKIFEEIYCNLKLTIALEITFRSSSLDSLNKKVPHILILHGFNNLSAYFTQHQISFFVFEWVMETRFGTRLQILDERIGLRDLSVRLGEHNFSGQWIYNFFNLFGVPPLSINKIVSMRM